MRELDPVNAVAQRHLPHGHQISAQHLWLGSGRSRSVQKSRPGSECLHEQRPSCRAQQQLHYCKRISHMSSLYAATADQDESTAWRHGACLKAQEDLWPLQPKHSFPSVNASAKISGKLRETKRQRIFTLGGFEDFFKQSKRKGRLTGNEEVTYLQV